MNPVRCKKCSFEASPAFIVDGKCPACRMPTPKDMMNSSSVAKARLVKMELCACGCGISFNVYDYRGRTRKYCDRRHQYKHQVVEAKRRAMISAGHAKSRLREVAEWERQVARLKRGGRGPNAQAKLAALLASRPSTSSSPSTPPSE